MIPGNGSTSRLPPGDGSPKSARADVARVLLLLCLLSAFGYAWRRYREVPLIVVGQPSSTGLLQREKEQPFFASLHQRSGIPFRVQYSPLEAVGFKDTHQLQMLKDHTFDLVSLRFLQNGAAEPSLDGIDLAGLNTSYEETRKVIAAYSGTVDRYLQERFDAKLLGVWSFGPQEIYCRKPVRRLEDLRGLKVRVGSPTLAAMVTELGSTPAVLPFDETKAALASGLVDCAVSSAASGNFAGWPEHTQYYFPLALHFGLNGYAISLRTWNALSPGERVALQASFDAYVEDLWAFTRTVHLDAIACNTGGDCRLGRGYRYRMELVTPSPQDAALLRRIARDKLFPAWGARCNLVHADCTATWTAKLAPLFPELAPH